MADHPKAMDAETLRNWFLHAVASAARYWADLPDKTPLERCSGLAFSVLCIIDGVDGGGCPSLDLVARPHPDDKAFRQAEGCDWVQDGTVINECMLHDHWAGRVAP